MVMKNDCRKEDLVRRFRTMTLSELQPPRRAVPQRQPFSISCQTEHCCFQFTLSVQTVVFLLRWFSWIEAKSSLLEVIRVLSCCQRGQRLEQSSSECHSGGSVGTFQSSRDSQPAYSTDNETHKHQTLIFTLTHSLKIYLKSEAETFTTSPGWREGMETHSELKFSLNSAESGELFIPCSLLVRAILCQ